MIRAAFYSGSDPFSPRTASGLDARPRIFQGVTIVREIKLMHVGDLPKFCFIYWGGLNELHLFMGADQHGKGRDRRLAHPVVWRRAASECQRRGAPPPAARTLRLRSAEMATNGTLLTAAVAHRLAEAGLTRLQITFDGDPTSHDTLRVTRNGRPTFDKILRNIGAASAVASYELAVRHTFARHGRQP